MSKLEFNTKLLDQYLNLLSNLSIGARKYLIEKLENSIGKKPNSEHKDELFGSWQSNESPEQLVNEIYSNRKFGRSIENFE